MNTDTILARLRGFLLAVAAGLFAGTIVELLLIGHDEGFTQLVPFGLCGLGLLLVGLAYLRPLRPTLMAMRACMALIALGSLFGVYEHIAGNIAFEREIRPGAAIADVALKGLSGANPLLAPAMLLLAAVLACAATYYHPALAAAARPARGAVAERYNGGRRD